LLVLALLGLALVAVLGIERLRGGIALARWQRSMRARGARLTLAELAPTRPPDKRGLPPDQVQTRLGWPALRGLDPGEFPLRLTYTEPGRAVALGRGGPGEVILGTNRTWAEFERRLSSALPLAQQVIETMRGRDWALEVDYAAGFRLRTIEIFGFINASRGFAAATQLAVRGGQMDEARTLLSALLVLPQAGREGRLLIDLIGRLACTAIAFPATWQALQSPDWTDDQLAELQAAWERPRFLDDAADCLEMERAVGIAGYFDLAHRDLLEFMRVSGVLAGPGWSSTGARPTFVDVVAHAVPGFDALISGVGKARAMAGGVLWRWIWLPHDQLYYSRALQEGIDYTRRLAETRSAAATLGGWPGGTNAAGKPVFLADRIHLTRSVDRLRRASSLAFLPRFSSALDEAVKAETIRALTVTAIALQRCQLRHGHPPAALAELVPEFLAAVPIDPGDGARVRYRVQADGAYLLYAVGANRRDDGGDPRSESTNGVPAALYEGRDCVWPRP
jgi:hypothetical protein